MGKAITCFLILFFSSNLLFSQTLIRGTLYGDQDEEVNLRATVIAHANSKTGDIVSYGFSNSSGHFELNAKCECDSLVLVVKSLSIVETTHTIANKPQSVKIPVKYAQHSIDEVVVKAPSIISRKDTTTYIVSSFMQQKDFSVGDVIARMPCFDVDAEGKISYQGQPIQKYYIEGLDLLEKRYALANSNIPHSSVASVEVLHNHQPVRLLEGLTETNQTSVNIKLKRNTSLTGRLEAGAGGYPAIWEANATPMIFNRNMQAVGSWQSNNSGSDLLPQHQSISISGGSISGATLLKQNYLGVPGLANPNISKNKYLKNQANLLTFNFLTKGYGDTEVKLNGSYYNDWVDMHSSITSSYFMLDTTIALVENQSSSYQFNSLTLEATLTQNASKRYLVNKISYGGVWDSERAFINSHSNQSVRSEIPHQTISNTFELVKPINGSLFFVESVVDYNYSPQTLRFSPNALMLTDVNSSEIEQEITNTNFTAHNKLKYSYPIKRFIASSTLEVNYHNEGHRTSINTFTNNETADSLRNSLSWYKLETQFTEDIEYKNNDVVISIAAPLRFAKYDINDRIHDASETPSYLSFIPRASVRYTPIPNLSARLSVSYNQSISSPNSLAQGSVIVSHRLIKKDLSAISERNAIRYNASLTYRAPTLGLFSSLHYSRSYSQSNMLVNKSVLTSGMFLYQSINKDNTSVVNNLSSEVKWYISSIKTTVGLNADFGDMSMQHLVSGKFADFNQQVVTLKPSLLFNYSKLWSADYSIELKHITSESEFSKTTVRYNSQKINIFMYPKPQHILGLETELYSSKREGQDKHDAVFANLLYSFKPKGKRISFRMQCRNLLNTSKYVNHYEDDFSIITTQYDIRPREFIFSVLMSLGRNR
jgi:hypothetical protein